MIMPSGHCRETTILVPRSDSIRVSRYKQRRCDFVASKISLSLRTEITSQFTHHIRQLYCTMQSQNTGRNSFCAGRRLLEPGNATIVSNMPWQEKAASPFSREPAVRTSESSRQPVRRIGACRESGRCRGGNRAVCGASLAVGPGRPVDGSPGAGKNDPPAGRHGPFSRSGLRSSSRRPKASNSRRKAALYRRGAATHARPQKARLPSSLSEGSAPGFGYASGRERRTGSRRVRRADRWRGRPIGRRPAG